MARGREFKEIEPNGEPAALGITPVPFKAVVTSRGLSAEFAKQTSLRIKDLELYVACLRKAKVQARRARKGIGCRVANGEGERLAVSDRGDCAVDRPTSGPDDVVVSGRAALPRQDTSAGDGDCCPRLAAAGG